MKKNTLIVMLGGRGSGKTTLLNKLLTETNITKLVTHTTRNIRDDEVDGIDYHFVTKKEFKNLKKIEYSKYHNNYKGLSYKEYENNLINSDNKAAIVTLDRNGVKSVINKLDCNIVVVYIDAPLEDIRGRLIDRYGPEKAKEELKQSIEEKEYNNDKLADYVIYNRNGKLEKSYKKLKNIIKKYTKDKKRLSY